MRARATIRKLRNSADGWAPESRSSVVWVSSLRTGKGANEFRSHPPRFRPVNPVSGGLQKEPVERNNDGDVTGPAVPACSRPLRRGDPEHRARAPAMAGQVAAASDRRRTETDALSA